MTDKEIVIALQKCNNGKGHRCSECPALSKYNYRICKATIDKLAVNLIERLQSENTRLTEQLENAEVLDNAGYRKQSDTVKEFADCVNELTTAEMLLWLAENESIDIWHTATEGIIYVWRNGNAVKFKDKTLAEAIKQAYDWAKQEVTE